MKIYPESENEVHLMLSRTKINSSIGHAKKGDIIAECSLEEISKKYNGQMFILNYTDSLKNGDGFDCSGKIENNVFDVVGKITASIGVSIYKNNESTKEIISRADEALYFSKNNGRNKISFK